MESERNGEILIIKLRNKNKNIGQVLQGKKET
jgi:hypothetical protein